MIPNERYHQLKDITCKFNSKNISIGYKLDYYFDSKIDSDLGFSVTKSLSYNMIIGSQSDFRSNRPYLFRINDV